MFSQKCDEVKSGNDERLYFQLKLISMPLLLSFFFIEYNNDSDDTNHCSRRKLEKLFSIKTKPVSIYTFHHICVPILSHRFVAKWFDAAIENP